MDKCFVIQPFNTEFNKLYDEVFADAIVEAGFQPYRIDQDSSVRVPIEAIERGIRQSLICFAEITTDNPNVWYELGFAFACNKDVVMICSDKRVNGFPFDIRHKHIITYNTQTPTPSDWKKLRKDIVEKINAYIPPSSRNILWAPSQKKWVAQANRGTPQWASYHEIIKNYELHKISCRFKTESPYFRFGFKLTELNGKLFGDSILKTGDPNLIIHVGKNSHSSDLFLTIQPSGGGLPDEVLFEFKSNEWIYLDLEISKRNALNFSVQHELRYSTVISPEIKKRLFMVAWGDSHEYKITVDEISVLIN